jgi:hypothetical protein
LSGTFDLEHDHGHDHDHDHDHVHSSREVIEQQAIDSEGEETPGSVIGNCLLRILNHKGIVPSAVLHRTIETLEQMGKDLLGASLVARAWVDPDFKELLLRDGK